MPRRKAKPLTKIKKKGADWKEKRIEEIREASAKYPHAYILCFGNQRNGFIKDIRAHFGRDGKLIYGKNKLVQVALGRFSENETQENIHKISRLLQGERGVLFTEHEPSFVESFFASYRPQQFARAGELTSFSVVLEEGTEALSRFPHSIEPQLRSLGLPTLLKDGRIQLMGTSAVCIEGKPLTSGQAQLLKLLDVKMSQFTVTVEAHWHKGGFMSLK